MKDDMKDDIKDDMTGGIPYGGAANAKQKNVLFICAIGFFVVPLHANCAKTKNMRKNMKRFILPMFALVCGMQLWAQNEEIPVQEDEYQVLVRQIDARALGLPEVQAEDTAAEEEAEVSAEADTLPFVHPLPVLEPVRMRAAAPAASACPVDSIVGRDPEGKYVTLLAYRYDSKDREVESASWQWVDGKKTGVSKSEKEFYEDGKQKMTATWTWDAEKGDWRGSSKNEYEYDASGHTVNCRSGTAMTG